MHFFLFTAASAATLNVGSGATYSSIGSAVAAASDGDTIQVAAGTYAESVDLAGKDLEIVGAGSTTIVEPSSDYAFYDGDAHLYY